MPTIYLIDFKDSDGKRYIFTQENFDKHKDKHFPLTLPGFFNRMKDCILNPTFIYPSYKDKNCFCFYYFEYEMNSRKRYTKVVVKRTKYIYYILTGFRPDNIPETKYFISPCTRP